MHSFTGNSEITAIKLDSAGTYQWHTFYGSSSGDSGDAVDVDDAGNIYITGSSRQTWNGPSPSNVPLHSMAISDWGDIAILKLNSSGGYRWHTFYGSSDSDDARDIAIDSNNNIYIVGNSYTNWYGPGPIPPLHAYSGSSPLGDMVVLKLNTFGGYQWHTFYGSAACDTAYGIDVNANGDVFIAGDSCATWDGPNSTPPLNPYTNGTFGFEMEIAVLKLEGNGTYQWHTFYGSPSVDVSQSINIKSSSYLTL